MKHAFVMTMMGAVACLWLATAQAGAPSPKFLGTWEMDMSRMEPAMPAGGAPYTTPKSITVTVKESGGKWATEAVVVMGDGTKQTPLSTPVTVDGTPNPIPGNPMVDTLVVTLPDPNTAIATALKDGKPVSKETYQLSPDGQQLLHTIDTVGLDGNPVHVVQVLNRKQ
jgi:hypothetical protein